MSQSFYDDFRTGPQAWTNGQAERLWGLLINCQEGPEIAAGMLAAGVDPGDAYPSWLWLIGQFLEEGDRAKAAWALEQYLGCSVDEALRAFGADPAAPAVPRLESSDDVVGVSVLELPGAVVLVEDRGSPDPPRGRYGPRRRADGRPATSGTRLVTSR